MRFWRPGHLGGRLVLAFLGVALLAEAVFAATALLTEQRDFAALAASQRSQTTSAVVSALKNAYRASTGWAGAEIEPAVALAGAAQAALVVDLPTGSLLVRTGPTDLFTSSDAVQVRRPVLVNGSVVARLHLAFPRGIVISASSRLRSALARSVALSASLGAVAAIAVAFAAARGLARPIRQLSDAARELGEGRSGTRVGSDFGPTELADLGRSFDSMAASLERHERLRRAMVSDIAHELRTPIAVLQGETEALVEGVSRPTLKALVSLHDEALRLGRMVDDLQILASADSAGLRMERAEVDLAEVSASAAHPLRRRFESGGVELRLDLSSAPVCGDTDRLGQVVTNLLVNAEKFTPPGGVVNLYVGPYQGMARLRVTDTGPGIPAEEREHVFERFFRGSSGRRVGGSGIGLAVVKELVEAHGGSVRVEDAFTGGASFVVSLPLGAQTPAT